MRKTIEVEKMREEINRRLESSTCSPEARNGMAHILEWVLMETGNYKGFGFVEWLSSGHALWVKDGKPNDTTPYMGDKSRIFYY